MQARIFDSMHQYMISLNKSTLGYSIIIDVISDFICEFVKDHDLLSELQQSGAGQKAIEVLTSRC